MVLLSLSRVSSVTATWSRSCGSSLALYDLKTNRETTLFPRKPFRSIRIDYVAKLQEFYRAHGEWCSENNDPRDPETVDSTLQGELAVSDSEHALAFVISYKPIQKFAGPVQKPGGPGKVVYVYRHVNDETRLDYREMLFSEVEKRFGKLSWCRLLEPVALQEIFGASDGIGDSHPEVHTKTAAEQRAGLTLDENSEAALIAKQISNEGVPA
jgi:hypothetical protein